MHVIKSKPKDNMSPDTELCFSEPITGRGITKEWIWPINNHSAFTKCASRRRRRYLTMRTPSKYAHGRIQYARNDQRTLCHPEHLPEKSSYSTTFVQSTSWEGVFYLPVANMSASLEASSGSEYITTSDMTALPR
jgi:hypothetical protein